MDVPRVVKCLCDRYVPTRDMTLESIELAKAFLSKTLMQFGLLVIVLPLVSCFRLAVSSSTPSECEAMLTCRQRPFEPFRKIFPEEGRLRNSLTRTPNSQNSLVDSVSVPTLSSLSLFFFLFLVSALTLINLKLIYFPLFSKIITNSFNNSKPFNENWAIKTYVSNLARFSTARVFSSNCDSANMQCPQ